MKLNQKYIKRPKNDNIKLQKNDDDFMKDSTNQAKAEIILQHRADSKNWTKQEFITHARKRGFLKTEQDRKIVESIVQKKGFKNIESKKSSPRRFPILTGLARANTPFRRESKKHYKKFF